MLGHGHLRSVVVFLLILDLLAKCGCQPVCQRCQFGVGETRLGMGEQVGAWWHRIDAFGVITGLAVLVVDVVAVANLTGPENGAAVESLPPTSTTVATAEPVPAMVGRLPDVGPAVTRVLEWSGNAGFADRADLAQLPPSVANVLIEYGVPLRVPTSPEAPR